MSDENLSAESVSDDSSDARAKGTGQEGQGDEGASGGAEGNEGASTGKAHREAARYRVQLREVEAERDELAEKVSGLQKQIVEGMLGDSVKPEAFWSFISQDGGGVESLLDEDGSVNGDTVAENVRAARDYFGIEDSRMPNPYLGQEQVDSAEESQWVSAFR